MSDVNTFYEWYDLELLNYIINKFSTFKSFLRKSCFEDEKYNPLKLLINILRNCDDKGRLKVKYIQINKARQFAQYSVSYQSMVREIRHVLAKNHYVDIDGVNMHPVLLSYLCKLNNFNCSYLDKYISNRDEILKSFKDRDEGKTAYLALTNGGHGAYNSIDDKSEHLVGYQKEMKNLHNSFSKLDPVRFKKFCEDKKKKGKTWNLEACYMNQLLCEMENKVLDVMIKNLNKKGNKDLVKCFDGLMLPKGDYDLIKCEKAINKKFKNLNLKLSMKPFDQGDKILEIINNAKIPKFILPKKEFIFSDDIEPSYIQLEQYKLLLNEIPDNFYNKISSCDKIILGSKNWANCKSVLDILDKVISNKSKLKINIMLAWNTECIVYSQNINISTLIYYHKKCIKPKLKPSMYFRFKMCKHIDLMEHVEKLNIDIKTISQEFITHRNGKPNLEGFENISNFKNKIVFVKSRTGSGKTDFLKYIASKLGHTFISVATRKILAEYHSSVFNTNYYLEKGVKLNNPYVWVRGKDKNGMSIVLDSLVKIKIDKDEKYCLFLDETTSLFEYLNSEKSNMKKIRRHIYNILVYLIQKAEYVFCTDADINTATVQLIQNLLKLKIDVNKNNVVERNEFCEKVEREELKEKQLILFDNIYKSKLCDVYELGLGEMTNILISKIENREKVFVCSDSKNNFNKLYLMIMKNIIDKIKAIKKKKRTANQKLILEDFDNGLYAFYSSEDGNKNDFQDIELIKKFMAIFVSPTITTGVDISNHNVPVFGFYFGSHLTATTICQQLGRIRNPTNIYVYFQNCVFQTEYTSIDEAIINNDLCRAQFHKVLKIAQNKKINIDSVESQYKDIIDFTNSFLHNVRFYTLDILKNKGHKINYYYDVELNPLLKTKIDKKDEIEDDSSKYKYICKDYRYITDEDVINNLKLISSTNKNFNSYLNAKTIYSKADTVKQIINTNDLQDHKINDRRAPITLFLLALESMKLDINNFNYFDDYEKISESKKTFRIDEQYIKAFRLTKTKYEGELSEIKMREFLMTMAHNLMPYYVSNHRNRVNGELIRYKQFNFEKVEEDVNMFSKSYDTLKDKEKRTENNNRWRLGGPT